MSNERLAELERDIKALKTAPPREESRLKVWTKRVMRWGVEVTMGAFAFFSEKLRYQPPVARSEDGQFAVELDKANWHYNAKFGSVKGYVNGQGLPPQCDFRYGITTMKGTGCEIIAVHNAMVKLGKPQELRDVVLYHESHARLLFGIWGSDPLEAMPYFTSKGVLPTVELDPSRFDAVAAAHPVSIFSFWNDRGNILEGVHTVALVKNSDGSIEVYNWKNRLGRSKTFSSIAYMIENPDDEKPERKLVPIVLMGVRNW